VSKALDVLGERWTLLVLRELVAGATRYRDLQRGLGRISPSVLSARLKTLLEHGVIEKSESETAQGYEYRLTAAGAELAPLIEAIGVWGQRWVRSRMSRDELDIEHLMLSVQRDLVPSAFPQQHAVIAIVFSDQQGAARRWWLLVDEGSSDLCTQAPGRSVDLTLICSARTLAEIVVGDITLQDALASERLQTKGAPKLVRSMPRWFKVSELASIAPARA
jgi:DNA-binding HxlR family transcriptional regulator